MTEYGIADLYGKSLRERARALINIAHPKSQRKLGEDRKRTIEFAYINMFVNKHDIGYRD